MNVPQLMWAVGLFEGEGTILRDLRSPKTFALEINMTDFDVIRRFQQIVGAGNLSTRYDNDPVRQPQLRCRIGKSEDVQRILNAFLPHFGDRRAHKALDVLDVLECT